MPALPLYQLARKGCIKNIRCETHVQRIPVLPADVSPAINDVGDIPYELIRPVLIKLENPEQLVGTACPERLLC